MDVKLLINWERVNQPRRSFWLIFKDIICLLCFNSSSKTWIKLIISLSYYKYIVVLCPSPSPRLKALFVLRINFDQCNFYSNFMQLKFTGCSFTKGGLGIRWPRDVVGPRQHERVSCRRCRDGFRICQKIYIIYVNISLYLFGKTLTVSRLTVTLGMCSDMVTFTHNYVFLVLPLHDFTCDWIGHKKNFLDKGYFLLP